MQLVEKGDYDEDGDYENPQIPEDYYHAKLQEFRSYDRDDEAIGLIMVMELVEDEIHGDEYAGVELPLFAPANLSVPREGSDANQSRLATQLENLGQLEAVLEILDCKDIVLAGAEKAIARDQDDLDDLENAIRGALSGHTLRVQVEDNNDGDESVIAKLQQIVDE